MKKPIFVTILGKRYRLIFDHRLARADDGDCDDPREPGKTIRIRKKLSPIRELEITLHETLHAADWHKDEAWVEQVAHDVARILWRLGYRREDVES